MIPIIYKKTKDYVVSYSIYLYLKDDPEVQTLHNGDDENYTNYMVIDFNRKEYYYIYVRKEGKTVLLLPLPIILKR